VLDKKSITAPKAAFATADKGKDLFAVGTDIAGMPTDSAGALIYMARVLAQVTIPHSNIKQTQFVRQNGNQRLVITDVQGIGLPYGVIPRLLLSWLTTEATRRKTRRIELGHSLSQFLSELGLNRAGGPRGDITRLREQMNRLFSCAIHLGDSTIENDHSRAMLIADDKDLWWNPSDQTGTLWQSHVTLSDRFFDAITDRPIPVDMRALSALRRSPLALDLYCWATYRASYASTASKIPWSSMQLQFGADYQDSAQGRQTFKRRFDDALRKVKVVYPALNLDLDEKGVTLFRSAPSVKLLPRRLK